MRISDKVDQDPFQIKNSMWMQCGGMRIQCGYVVLQCD